MKAFLWLLFFAASIPTWAQITVGGDSHYRSEFQASILDSFLRNKQVSPLALLLASDTSVSKAEYESINERINEFCSKLKKKYPRKENDHFLKYVFYKVHKTFLKKYVLNSSLSETFKNGDFDCVSGTSLYAIVLGKLGIDYQIKETRFHVYLVTNFANKQQLWESTDPFHGWTNLPEEISKREEKYRLMVEQNKNAYFFKEIIYNQIDLYQLAGLQFYNKGISFYNSKNYKASILNFEKALALYNSERIKEIFELTQQVFSKKLSFYSSSSKN